VYAAPVGALPEPGAGGRDDPARDLPALYAEWTARQGRELAPAQAEAFVLAVADGAEAADA